MREVAQGIKSRLVQCMRTASAMYASDKMTRRWERCTYSNDSAMYASNRNHGEDSEVDGDKRQPLLTTRQR